MYPGGGGGLCLHIYSKRKRAPRAGAGKVHREAYRSDFLVFLGFFLVFEYLNSCFFLCIFGVVVDAEASVK